MNLPFTGLICIERVEEPQGSKDMKKQQAFLSGELLSNFSVRDSNSIRQD
jgi:hypothetical protein